MQPGRTGRVVSDAALIELGNVGRILSRRAGHRFRRPFGGDLLAEAEVLLTGWGSPRIDAGVLAPAPRLKLIAHAAGTVRGLLDPLSSTRGSA